MAISMRSRDIASNADSHVEFSARDPQGPTAVSIFMSHAAQDISFDKEKHKVIRGILDRCAGLPIALAMTGRTVARHMSYGFGFDFACQAYLKLLADEMNLGASLLDSAISLSLKSLEQKTANEGSRNHRYNFREMYTSLCVLRNQQWAPSSVVALMWKLMR